MNFDEEYERHMERLLNEDWKSLIKKAAAPAIIGGMTLGGLYTGNRLYDKIQKTKEGNVPIPIISNISSEDSDNFDYDQPAYNFNQPATPNKKVEPTKNQVPPSELTNDKVITNDLINFILYFESHKMYKAKDDQQFTLFKNKMDGNIEMPGGITANGIEDAKRLGTLPKDYKMPSQMSKSDVINLLKNSIIPAYAKAVDANVTVPISLRQKQALISFAYNAGIGALKQMINGNEKDPRLNQSNYRGVKTEFSKWNKVVKYQDVKDPKTGKIEKVKIVTIEPGLTKRRTAESKLFNSSQ